MAVFHNLILILMLTSSTKAFEKLKWTHRLILDRSNKFHIFWTPSEDLIRFELQVQTLGYVAIGFSPNGGMKGADIALAWVDDQNGKVHLSDMKAFGNSMPQLDSSQDLDLLGGYQNDSHTVITFQRPWSSCDQEMDFELNGDTTRLIWSYSDSDFLTYHGPNSRGTRSVYLQELPQIHLKTSQDPDLKIWDLTSQVELPNDDHTHYWCRIFKAPFIDRKHHMVKLEPLIQPGNEAYVHHMVLYECHVSSSDVWFDQHAKRSSGAACYSPNMPAEWTFCLATNAWAWVRFQIIISL